MGVFSLNIREKLTVICLGLANILGFMALVLMGPIYPIIVSTIILFSFIIEPRFISSDSMHDYTSDFEHNCELINLMPQMYSKLPGVNSYGQRNPSPESLLHNTNVTFLAFLYKFDIKGFQNQHKIKLLPVRIELTAPTIYGL